MIRRVESPEQNLPRDAHPVLSIAPTSVASCVVVEIFCSTAIKWRCLE